MLENIPNVRKPMNRLKIVILLLTTNLSWWLMKQKKALTVLTVSYFVEYHLLELIQ